MAVSITVICLLGVVATTLAMSVKHIPEGKVYTLRRRHDTQPHLLTAGTHWIVPLRDHVAHKISLTGRSLHLDTTMDSDHHAQGTVYWQVLDPKRADAVIERADTLIRQRALESLRQGNTATHLKEQLNRTLRPQGMLVTRVDLHVTPAMPAAA